MPSIGNRSRTTQPTLRAERSSHMEDHNTHTQEATQSSKHVWTKEEDAVLIQCLLELRAEGKYISDNGFKNGYLTILETMLTRKALGCRIKGNPHIQSRIKTMKREWHVVYDMIYGTNNSRFEWDDLNKMVIAEKEVWDTYVKSNKKAAVYKNKSLPHFEELCTIFGKDRATGREAQTADEMAEEMTERNVGTNPIDLEDPNFDASISSTQIPNVATNESTSSGKKKRKTNLENAIIGQLKEVVGTFGEGLSRFSKTIDKMSTIMRTWGSDEILHERRTQLYEQLRRVEGLTRTERHAASIKISSDPSLLSVFPTIPDDEKVDWIHMVIG